MRNPVRALIAGAAAVAIALGAAACGPGTSSSANQEKASVNSTYDKLVANQPAGTMNYSPTRATKNFWIDTWDEPGKLAYVYLQSATGDIIGYYVLEGLPVNYCTSLVPPFEIAGNSHGNVLMPRASVDGTWSSGNNCNTYYGKDATTGAYVEYSVGLGINTLLFDKPVARFNTAPLGDTVLGK